jgi:parallel beta-helix repeat protein
VYKDRVETTYRPITDFASRIVVAQDGTGHFNGKDEKPILEAIKKAGKAGGTIFIKPGKYLIRREINPNLKSGITITGTPQTILRLPFPVLTTAAAGKGQDFLMVADASELAAGTSVQVLPPAGMKAFPGGDKKSFAISIKAVQKGKIVLGKPLPCVVPQKSRMGYRNNVFSVYRSEKNIAIKNLVIDGGRKEGIGMPGHCSRCALLAHGRWTYAGGPTAPPIENVQVINCHIRNCYGRAVAMYWVVRGKVEGCLIENIADEAIDLDHFSFDCVVRGNEVRNCVTGVTINDGSYCTIEHNRFTNCGVGVTIWWWHLCPHKDIDIRNKIRHNFIYSPKRAGISIGGRCFWNEVTGNFVEGGIKVADPRNVVEQNHTPRAAEAPSPPKR